MQKRKRFMKSICENVVIPITPSVLVCIFMQIFLVVFSNFMIFKIFYITFTNLYINYTHILMDTSIQCVTTTTTRTSKSHQYQLHILDLKSIFTFEQSCLISIKCKMAQKTHTLNQSRPINKWHNRHLLILWGQKRKENILLL